MRRRSTHARDMMKTTVDALALLLGATAVALAAAEWAWRQVRP